MNGYGEVLLAGAIAALVLLLVTWVVSVPLRNVSIVDIVWGLAFVVIAWTTRLVADGVPARQNLLVLLVTLWGLRLSVYLLWRNAGKDEDFRYRKMRDRRGDAFVWQSLLTVFVVQAVLAWIVSLPVQLAQVPDEPEGLGPLAFAGIAVWVVGLTFEAVGDHQLARFKGDPANKGKVMDRGLWRYTRHPNYFGDFAVWWGIFLVAAETRVGWIGVIGPLVMSFLLLRVSGVALLERGMDERRPGYAAYIERTSAFFPRPPKAGMDAGPPKAGMDAGPPK
jgi:steroid 5-alpha reductase family enzyme